MFTNNKNKFLIKKKNDSLISWKLFFLLTVMYTVAYNKDFRAISILWYGISALSIVALFFVLFVKRVNLRAGFFSMWEIAFFTLCLLSSFWALDYGVVLQSSISLFLVFIVNLLLINLIRSREDLEKVLFANFISILLCLVYIVFTMDLSQIGTDRVGEETLGTLWNANEIGLNMCIGYACALYFFVKSKQKWKKLLFLISVIAFGLLALFTGSRKAFLMLVLISSLLIWLKSKRRFLMFGVLCAAIIAFFVIVIKVEVFYDVLGRRLENMLKGFLGESGGSSFDTRAEMIKFGWNWFLEKPVLGWGVSNFSVLYQQVTGWGTYAHNNFIEILVSLGFIGFLVYYSVYFYLFIKIAKNCFVKRDLLAIILFAVNISVFIMQIAIVSFYNTVINCVLMLGMAYFNIQEVKDENS